MHTAVKVGLYTVGGLATWELAWWIRRRIQRGRMFRAAQRRAKELNRVLVVVGAPDGGVTAGYGCGDIVVDIVPTSTCKSSLKADITGRLPWSDDSVVVFVSCVLEYVDDEKAALAELRRISGGEVFLVTVEPWTFTAFLYPGTKRQIWPGSYTKALKR